MTIRVRLTIAFVLVVLAANLLLSLVTIRRVGQVLIGEVQNRVQSDLVAAREVYSNHVQSIAQFLGAVSLDDSIASGLQGGDPDLLSRELQKIHRANRADMLCLLDHAGRVIYRPANPVEAGDSLAENEVVRMALQKSETVTGTLVVSREDLRRQGVDPLLLARFGPAESTATQPDLLLAGMVVAAAVPVHDDQGQLLGLLYGANLLNGRYRIVDTIRTLVFQNQAYDGKDIGTATIFQGDLRISTNVTTDEGSRAVGTRMSPEVADVVLAREQAYSQRAFVVNDWYISAYEPIRSPSGQTIGALYVGLLEAPYAHRQRLIVGVFLATVLVMAVATVMLLWLITKLMLRPIGRVIAMSRRVIGGDLSARVGIRRRGEMGMLLQAIDDMADAVAQREEKLKTVARQQIGQSEKLASIGRLAAGVAHEVNNPLTGVLTFAHLLRDKHAADEQDRSDLDLVIRETTRVRDIVRGLLDFARESPSRRQPLDINVAVRQMLTLLRSQKEFKGVRIVEELTEPLPKVNGDQNQLQQVLLNLALNACEAMPNGGILAIRTKARDSEVIVEVADTGSGIPKEHLDMIFDPFFTTKPVGKGTGLGLSVSYGIMQQHGGTIEVASEEGKGSTFTIVLPINAEQQTRRPDDTVAR
jgi:two-component system NtrC family sensor kinase